MPKREVWIGQSDYSCYVDMTTSNVVHISNPRSPSERLIFYKYALQSPV